MLATLGDLVEDIVVDVLGPLQYGSDTESHLQRRQGGSAANVAVAAARMSHPSRFLGQIGVDRAGNSLVTELVAHGVDVSCATRTGSTGAIVVLVDDHGERTMLTDRRSCVEVTQPDPAWLDGVTALHVPFYSFTEPPLSDTAVELVRVAHDRELVVSIDLSSDAVLRTFGIDAAHRLIEELTPSVVFANLDEAQAMRIDGALAGAVTTVKRGSASALVHRPGLETIEVPALPVATTVDSTGAGDTFAAGFLCFEAWQDDPIAACRAGHEAAAALLNSRQQPT